MGNKITYYRRQQTKKVCIGNLLMGSDYPVRIQTMTNTPTREIEKTIQQCRLLFDSGAELVRITAPTVKDAENLQLIKYELQSAGYKYPLVADIHYSPRAAITAAQFVEKVRINPGNYIDRNKGEKIEYNPQEYQQELEKIKKNLIPLVQTCKTYNTAMRIGVNHGSLSDRIMSRYGDTPEGMAESAIEFIRILHELEFDNVVISMKSSNTLVMVQACRILSQKLQAENLNYPLHLGVTEAGNAEDGRIKSAVGIGTLLSEGIGDTIRVSLTEDPEFELPVARLIVDYLTIEKAQLYNPDNGFNSYNHCKYLDYNVLSNFKVPLVITTLSSVPGLNDEMKSDFYFCNESVLRNMSTQNKQYSLSIIAPLPVWKNYNHNFSKIYPLLSISDIQHLSPNELSGTRFFIEIKEDELNEKILQLLTHSNPEAIIYHSQSRNLNTYYNFLETLKNTHKGIPVVTKFSYESEDSESLIIKSACDYGPVFLDGNSQGIWLHINNINDSSFVEELSFGILQATRARFSKTEFISCPGCGRTQFNLQETLNKVKEKTARYKGLKIAVMGCIVNGPGEMADADFGYVGSGNGKVTLYRGKEVVKKNIPEDLAIEELLQLIEADQA